MSEPETEQVVVVPQEPEVVTVEVSPPEGDALGEGMNGCQIVEPEAADVSQDGDTSQDSLDDDNTPKTSRELKSILALSKEAKLDTNITQRRKTADKVKKSPKKSSFPVTAESELENFEVKIDEKKVAAKKRKSSFGVEEGATGEEIRRGVQGISPDFVMTRKPNKDIFCWRCHHDNVQVACETCPRAYHLRCLKQTITDPEHWPCPECVAILKAENTQTRSKAMKGMSLEHLCSLLKFAVKRMIQCNGSEPFIHPVDENQFPEYRSYIIQPMTLTMLEKNIKENAYGSTQAFEADAKWILHNSIIFNSYQSKLTTAAKTIVKICKQEMAEVENCPSCYLNANTKKHTWFIEVCPRPHLLVWAKLKGFPYWPAKVMSINAQGMADVRFFGAHDKAWVSVKDCYLYSVKDPNSGKQKRNDIIECVKELELYVDNLREVYGRVNFAPFKTPLEADSQLKQLQVFLPNYRNDGKEVLWKPMEVKATRKSGSNEESSSEDEKSTESSGDEDEDGEEEEDEESDDERGKRKEKSNGEKHKEGMTRIDYRDSPTEKSRPPIRTIIIRKRYSTDSVQDSTPKLPRHDSNKNETDRPVDNHVEDTSTTPEKVDSVQKEKEEEERKSPNSKTSPTLKLRISDQLIKKLEEISDKKEEDNKESKEEQKDEDKVETSEAEKKEDDGKTEEEKVIESEPIPSEEKKNEEEVATQKDEGSSKIEEEKRETETKTIEEKEKSEETKETDVEMVDASVCNEPPPLEMMKKVEEIKKKPDESKKVEEVSRKRKHEEDNLFPPNKMVKLVPIENILQKKDLDETPQAPSRPDQLIVLKEVRVMKDGKEVKNKTKKSEDENKDKERPVKIKSEAESDEDNDVQYMEAKRQYLSALNISEKQKVPTKPKAHEIRTRSKTEEKKSKDTTKTAEEGSKETHPKPPEPVKEIYIKSLAKMQTPKHKARKSFPTPNYGKKTIVARKIIPKTALEDELTIVNSTTFQPTGNVMILPKLHYNKPVTRDIGSPPVLTMLPRVTQIDPSAVKKIPEGSQNYIPQNEETERNSGGGGGGGSGGVLLNNLLTQPAQPQVPVIDVENPPPIPTATDSDLGPLKDILPENLSKGVSELLCQPPPKLKPKPLGILNSVTGETGVPSTVGPVASRINAMAQKLSDCFRSLLVETITDLGKSNNPEATISSLKYEIEELNHKHSIELAEIRRNVTIVLKDIQKSVVEERERIINETKANCEMEMMKRVEEAKSKQWCANCSKEAQFYCCWNTSYCDYPCQQKHWPKHMSKCTQTTGQNQTANTTQVRTAGQQLVLTPTAAPKFGALFAKPQKVYLKRTNTTTFKPASGSITLVESTPGNFELLGSGPIAVNGKILASTSVIEKIKSGNIVTVTAPSGTANTQLTSANQKVNTVSKSTASTDSEH